MAWSTRPIIYCGAGPLALLIDPPLTPELRQEFVRMWVDVTNAGGAVGFLPPIRQSQVEPVAAAMFDRLASGKEKPIK